MIRSALAAVAALACAPPAGAGPFDDMLKHAPTHTNAVVLIDAKKVFASPVAKREKWAESAKQSGYGGLGFVPPDSDRVAIAAEVNFTTMARDFQVGFVHRDPLPTFKELAAREGGLVDKIADEFAVVSPRDAYFVTFPGQILAGAYPADRQYVARWLKADRAGKLPALAPALRAAADAPGDAAVTIALDLDEVLDPAALKLGLSVSPVVARQKDVNLEVLAWFLSRVKGLTFAARFGEEVEATVTVEFGEELRYKALLKDLFLELLDGHGAALAGVEAWEPTFGARALTLKGRLAPADLKRVVSLFAFPRPNEPEPAAAGDAPTAGATQRYLTAVRAALDDIKTAREGKDYAKTATWHEKAAAQIEHLGRRNVDPLAVDAAFAAAKYLRAIAGSLRGVPIDLNAAAEKAYVYGARAPYWGWGPYYGGWWGYRGALFAPVVNVETNLPQVRAEMAKAVADDQKRRVEAWTKIDDLMSEARRKLTDKYKTGF